MEFKKKRRSGRDADWKCIYCGKFVSYNDPDVVVKNNMRWDYHREDVYEETDIYHKRCKEYTEKLKETINKSI